MLLNTNDSGTLLGAIVQGRKNKHDKTQLEQVYNVFSNSPKLFLEANFENYSHLSENVRDQLVLIRDEAKKTAESEKDFGKAGEQALVSLNKTINTTAKKTTILRNQIGNFFKGLLNGIVSMVASSVISWGIDKVVKAIDRRFNPSKYIQREAKKSREAVQQIKSNFESMSSTVEDVKQRYAELAQEVKNVGTINQSQGTLSNDEYKEFLDISSQLSELFPTLTQGYDDNGKAILNLSGDVDTIVGSLNTLIETERQFANEQIRKELPSIWAGYTDDMKKAEDQIEKSTERIEQLRKNAFSDVMFFKTGTGINLAQEATRIAGIDYEEYARGYATNEDLNVPGVSTVGNYEYLKYDFSSLSEEQKKDLNRAFEIVIGNYERAIRGAEATIKEKTVEMYNNISSQLLDDDYYKNLAPEMQKVYEGMLFNYDYKSLTKKYTKGSDKQNFDDALNDVQNDLQEIFNTLNADPSIQQEFIDLYNKIFEIDTSEGVFAENIAKIQEYINRIAEMLGKNPIDIMTIFGLSNLDADLIKAKNAWVNQSTGKTVYDKETGRGVYDTEIERQQRLEYEEFIDSLSKSDLDMWNAALNNGEIDQKLLRSGKKNLEKYLKELQKVAAQNKVEIQSTDFVDAINEAKTAITSLEDLWNQAFGEGNLKIADKLEELSEGGTVDLTLRPEIDTSELKAAGWDADGGYATVLTSTYGDETETKFLNFTPIIVDPVTGEYKGVLTPEELDAYANDVINGVRTDDLNLQIGAEFSSITEAEKAAELIHNLHAAKHDGQDLYTDYDIIDIDKIEAVEKAFGGIGEEDSKVSLALANFEDTLVKFPGNAQKTKDAINELVTAYIDQTEVIQNLDESNAEMARRQLRDMGITNAEEVVQSRLSKQVKATQKAIAALAKQLVSYNETLNNTASTEDDIKNAQKELAKSVKEALKMYDAEGNPLEHVFEFSEGFIEKHSEDINAMAAGDMEALDRVRLAAARGAVMEVTVGVPTEAAEQNINALMDMVAQADAKNIDIGASIDDSAFIDTLNNMMKAGIFTADQVSAAFESMGYEAVFRDNSYPVDLISMVTKKGANGMPTTVMEEMKNAGKVSFPSLEIIRKKGSSRGGAGAKYSAPSSSSTTSDNGSGGGGGGGSEPTQPKDDTEETFDWIEVAIQRIEEEMARLDKIVGNSYIKWNDRNSALTDEINKTTEAIKAQELAEEEYYRNANELQVNDGKGLNDDDYGENDYLVKEHDQKLLDEARAIWATGEYQEKVKHGLLTGDDIEKIQNKYLVETIKTYQEWINKGIAAGDAADDLRIKLGDLARTSFDHVKDEYDELIAFVTGSADIIDEKINRTEKKGYFVDKAYYHDLMALEEENYNYLAKKRDEMIKKRDEAVAAGYIEENSSEWNKMSQEIDGVTLAIEQSETKMVEYNNTLRQLDWDMFDWIEDRISRINSEAAFLVDLMSEERLVDDNGVFTAQGEATNAMYAVKYETYMRQARDYAEERKKIEADLINDPGNKELIKRREELIDLEQESIKNAQQEKEAIKSLVQEAINKAIESLQKLIDEQKTAIREAKDLYDYQKNIANQVKNIENIRKQLAAYAGDDSEENRARVQKLQQQLEEAEQQLQETEWDKYISETEKFLDDMMDDYSETLNKKLEDIDSLIEEMIQHANNNADTVAQTIQDETDKVGYTLTDEFSNIISGGRDQMVTDLQSAADNITTAITNVQAVIESIKEYVAEMAEYGKKTEEVESSGGSSKSDSDSGSDKKSDDSKKSDGGKKSDEDKKDEGSKGSGTNRKLTDKDYYGVALAIINGNYGWGTGEDMDSKLKAKGFDVNRVRDIINKLYAEGYVHSGAWVGRYQGITDLSPFAFNKYAKGSKRISSDQLAWTQEKGQELIFRSSDGAMLTPLNAGDKVFTAQMTDNLWELAKGRFTTNIPKSAGGNTINNSNAISITLPNVKNYEEFKIALQNDPKMTSFIQQITLGEISNGIKLNKKKY